VKKKIVGEGRREIFERAGGFQSNAAQQNRFLHGENVTFSNGKKNRSP
jgi:hypothetical protein